MKKLLKRIIRNVPGTQSLDGYLRRRYQVDEKETYARGHFYSPLPDIAAVRSQAAVLFRSDVETIPGVDLREEFQRGLLQELATFYPEFDWPKQKSPDRRYYSDNTMFGLGSGFSLYAMMRRFRPKRVIEIGSGFSSAIMLDTSERLFNDGIDFTFIDPFDERLLSLLRVDDHKRYKMIKDLVQNVDLSIFENLQQNDILFVDSSHVSKVGSDVNFILSFVLPAIQPGVIVHLHDIYWPFEYPESWIVDLRRAWNEAYVLRAFLQYNARFEILQFNHFLACRHRELFNDGLPTANSFWMCKKD